MESIFSTMFQFLRAKAFAGGVFGISLSLLLLIGLAFLYLKRNEVMTLTYGVTLLCVLIFTVLCIFAVFLISIFGLLKG